MESVAPGVRLDTFVRRSRAARDPSYNDGNTRIAFVTAAVFAELNGYGLDAPESEVVDVMLRLADGVIDEGALAEWLRSRLTAVADNNSR